MLYYTEKSLNDFGIKLKSNLNTTTIHESTSSNGQHNGNHGDKRTGTEESPKQNSPITSFSGIDRQSLSDLDVSTSSHHIEVDNVSSWKKETIFMMIL